LERPPERRQRCRDHHHLVDLRCRPLLQPPLQPARREPPGSGPVAEGDERRQLERLVEIEPARFARLELGADEVAALDRSPERGPRYPWEVVSALLSGAEQARA
jgi:hypothetical protein